MADEYSVQVCKNLETKFSSLDLFRPMRTIRYDAGDELCYNVNSVAGTGTAKVHLKVEKFVGGGFAGQVYRVKIISIEGGSLDGVEVNGTYAMKILIPPSGGSLAFRNIIYWIGFQAPFQLQVNPTAARAGAIWQKFIRRGAKIRFGNEGAVNDIHVTFVDNDLGSCGELSDWVEGRTWRLEVDEHMDLLDRWGKGDIVDSPQLGSPEFRAKKKFMNEFVDLLHDMGAHEFARQYEWSTCKSQPNCLKRSDTEDDPTTGLMAVDFRAGLALLPFLPMSPGDLKLIVNGLGRGSLVQFDRGNIKKLEAFMNANSSDFEDMRDLLDELKTSEEAYRNSVPDITHNHFRYFYSQKFRTTLQQSAVTGWKVRNLIDASAEESLRKSKLLYFIFFMLGLVPFLGGFVRKLWARDAWRKHYSGILNSIDYFKKALRGKAIESAIVWHRAGRIDEDSAVRVSYLFGPFFRHLPCSVLPVGIHKFLTDMDFAKQKLHDILVRPIKLYFDHDLREQWLHDMVADGQAKHIITEEDAELILSKIKEPFVQKYLKSLAVHVCTVPVTQVVSIMLAVIYVLMHPEMPRSQSWGIGLGIVALFQVIPLSPGSLVRGLYVLYLVIRERNFKDYNIAVFLGFFKYIGYLAFPIQMAYRYPELARFMAAHWATEAVHVVPVFGESGALLEHWVFCLFYNRPLTIRRRMRIRAEKRAQQKPRYWHVVFCAAGAAAIFVLTDLIIRNAAGVVPSLKDIWWLVVLVPFVCGSIITYGCGGAALMKRVATAAVCGVITALVYTAVSVPVFNTELSADDIASGCVWRIFIFTIFSSVGAILTELKMK
jgi:hypothetical protein